MSIAIYTYRDPYKLNKEAYWDEIKECPYFCVSQTLVNGLKTIYKKDFQQGRVTTIQYLIESLYEYWESTACRRIHADPCGTGTSAFPDRKGTVKADQS